MGIPACRLQQFGGNYIRRAALRERGFRELLFECTNLALTVACGFSGRRAGQGSVDRFLYQRNRVHAGVLEVLSSGVVLLTV